MSQIGAAQAGPIAVLPNRIGGLADRQKNGYGASETTVASIRASTRSQSSSA
jgi:hypothetical protein